MSWFKKLILGGAAAASIWSLTIDKERILAHDLPNFINKQSYEENNKILVQLREQHPACINQLREVASIIHMIAIHFANNNIDNSHRIDDAAKSLEHMAIALNVNFSNLNKNSSEFGPKNVQTAITGYAEVKAKCADLVNTAIKKVILPAKKIHGKEISHELDTLIDALLENSKGIK